MGKFWELDMFVANKTRFCHTLEDEILVVFLPFSHSQKLSSFTKNFYLFWYVECQNFWSTSKKKVLFLWREKMSQSLNWFVYC